jgi:hypothetical protein
MPKQEAEAAVTIRALEQIEGQDFEYHDHA